MRKVDLYENLIQWGLAGAGIVLLLWVDWRIAVGVVLVSLNICLGVVRFVRSKR